MKLRVRRATLFFAASGRDFRPVLSMPPAERVKQARANPSAANPATRGIDLSHADSLSKPANLFRPAEFKISSAFCL